MRVRVLLIDEHDAARTTLAQRLQRNARLELIGAVSNVEEAADLLANGLPDIVLLDTHRNDGRGIETCRDVRQRTDAPVVALATFMTPQLWRSVREAGASDYLLKHVDTERLARSIARLADQHPHS